MYLPPTTHTSTLVPADLSAPAPERPETSAVLRNHTLAAQVAGGVHSCAVAPALHLPWHAGRRWRDLGAGDSRRCRGRAIGAASRDIPSDQGPAPNDGDAA